MRPPRRASSRRPAVRRHLLTLLLLALCAAALPFTTPRARAGVIWRVGFGAGACTLADPRCGSIQAAVDAAASGDSVQIAQGSYTERVVISNKNLGISGAGPSATTVDGGGPSGGVFNPARRITFSVQGGVVSLSGLTIRGGSNPADADDFGGFGGGINNSGTLTLAWCVVSGNEAGSGGGIYNTGTLSLVNTTVRNNRAGNNGGGVYNDASGKLTLADSAVLGNVNVTRNSNGGGRGGSGAGILNFGTATLFNCTVADNTSKFGGAGIINAGGSLALNHCSVLNNRVTEEPTAPSSATNGGGIHSSGGTLTVAGSDISRNYVVGYGGGIYATHLTLSDSVVSDNVSVIGGGLYVATEASVTNSTLSGNRAAAGPGGGVYSLGALTVVGGAINDNSGSRGGGLACGGTLTLRDTTVRGNYAGDRGGGLYNFGKASVAGSTFSYNATGEGSGLFNAGPYELTAVNSTFSGNGTLRPAGSVVVNEGALEFFNCTIGSNDSYGAGVLQNRAAASAFRLTNTVVAGNAPTGRDLSGAFTSQGHNLVGVNGDNSGLTNGANGDIVGTTAAPADAKLLPLGNYGGPTQTQPPRATSPALDAGDDAVLSAPLSLNTDQRGLGRKAGAHVDVGAAEATGAESDARLIGFSAAAYAVAERGGGVKVNVVRTGPATEAAAVAFRTADDDPARLLPCDAPSGHASSRCDYEAALGTLTFAPGEDSKTFTVVVNDDAFTEMAETARLVLSGPTAGSSLGARGTAALEITDDAAEDGTNPTDLPLPFVRQQYHDFLNREPDTAGFNFWAGDALSACGAAANCAEVRRVNVSAAFFLSIEFQQTGYLAYRARKAAFGNLAGKPVPLTLEEMLSDLRRLGEGVVVGLGGWEARLEQNKRDYFDALASSARFGALYPQTLTPEQFVDALNANAGGALSPAERDALAAELKGGAKTRAQVLRAVAEDADLLQAESNRAFVLMQYFGYLRRDPDAAPDSDFGGYQFWLAKLNEFNGDFVAAEMVRAFLSSDEYRHRFGQ